MFGFEKLKVWQKTREFLKGIYKAAAVFPKQEHFGLSQHIRKSAISIFSNIAEATTRFGDVNFKRFIEIEIGSLSGMMSRLFIAPDNDCLSKRRFGELYKNAEVIAKMFSKPR